MATVFVTKTLHDPVLSWFGSFLVFSQINIRKCWLVHCIRNQSCSDLTPFRLCARVSVSNAMISTDVTDRYGRVCISTLRVGVCGSVHL